MVTLRVFLTWSHGCFFFFKQKTSYEMRISDWSSDVCSSDLAIMAKIAPAFAAEEHTRIVEQAGAVDLSRGGPAGGPIGGDLARLPRAPERTGDGGDRQSVVEGKSVSVRVDLGGGRINNKKKRQNVQSTHLIIKNTSTY